MGRGHGATRGSGPASLAQRMSDTYLGGFSNPELKKELANALADFDKEFGMPDYAIISADLGQKFYGKTSSEAKRIGINSRYEDGRFKMDSARHTMIHELAHTMDFGRSGRTDFDKKLTSLYNSFKSDYVKKDLHLGSYALTNRHEFFADAIAYHMTGKQDEYTTKVFQLAKSMRGK